MANIGITASLEYDLDTSGTNWVAIPKCKSISFPALTVASVDTTNLDNSDYYKTFTPGTIEPGNVSFTAEFSSDTYNDLFDTLRDVISWRVTSPDGDVVIAIFDGFLMNLSSPIEAEAEHMITGEIKVTGAVSLS